jgi:putative FmdB family regulatory protein
MPIYEYRRPNGTTFEVLQSMSDDPLTEDPETGVPVERVLHAPAIHFKGKGFYNTDYGTKRRNREQAQSSDSDGAKKSDAKADSSSSSSTPSSDGGTAKPASDSKKPDKKQAKKAS